MVGTVCLLDRLHSSASRRPIGPDQRAAEHSTLLWAGMLHSIAVHVAEVGKNVVAEGVGDVVAQVRDGALARHDGLRTKAKHSKHGKASVPELLGPHGLGLLS